MLKYNPNHNYMGCNKWQMSITKKMYKLMSEINYTSYHHDRNYKDKVLTEKRWINRLILKIWSDIEFIVFGTVRCTTRITQIPYIPVVWIAGACILLYTFFYKPLYKFF